MNKKILNFSYIEIFLVLSYLICWISISTSFYDILNFFEKENNSFNGWINFCRQLFNLIIFPILLIIFFSKCKNINFKRELLFIFFFFYLIFQIPGLFFSENSINNLVYIISALNILLIFILINISFSKRKYLLLFKITLLMLTIIAILNYKTYINFFISLDSNTLYTYFFSSETYFGKVSPRSTGSSRTLLFIMIISFLIFNKFFKKRNFLKISCYTLISTFILLFQSRTTITLLVVYILFNYIIKKNFSFNGTVKYFFIYFILPIIFLYIVLGFKQYVHDSDFLENFYQNNSLGMLEITKNFKRPIDPETYSSGRVEDWKNIISYIKHSITFGFGAQGDRFLINQSASNGIIYALSSSGILGIVPFVLFSFFSFWIVLTNLLKNFRFYISLNYLSSLMILLLLLRSILESSYAVFSVDFIIFYTFINYLNKFFYDDGN